METIYIYNGASRLTIPVTDSAERAHSLQQHNYVKLVWKSAENTPISANAYIEYEGQVFYALDDYFPTHKDGIYEYDIEFHAIEDTFNRPLFFRYVDILDQTTGETTSWKEVEWSLNGNLKTIADIVITCLNRAYNNAYFELPTDSYTDTLLMSYSFSGNSIADALSTIAEQNETEWWLETTTEYVDGKRKYILHFDKCEIGTTIELNDHYTEDANGVWQSGGLKSVSQSGNTNIIPQKLFVYGSERNIIKKTVEEETEGGKMNVSYDKKLRLPSTFPNGTKEHVIESAGVTLSLNDDSSISIGGINNHFEKVKIFDEVYPKMDMEVTAVSVQNPNSENPIYWLKGDRLTSITDEAPVDGSINPGKLGLLIEGCTLMCTFTSGLLNGREFECSWRESSAEIGLIPIDENDVQIPSGVYKPNVGDTFILWNLAMPQSSITIAQNELCVEAINYIEELATSITETDCVSEPEAFRLAGYDKQIQVGQRITVTSDVFRNGKLASRIIKFSYKLTKPYDISFTLASSRQTGRLATLENMIADVTHEVHAVNQVQQAISRRQWHDTEEMMSMLDSIQKQMVVVGDENNAFGTTCSLKYNSDTKQLLVSEGYVLHQSFTDNDFNGQWNIDSFTRDMSAIDPDGKTPFYVFFVCPKSKETAEKGYTDVASALPTYDDYYVFILGILSSEFEGKRAFNQTNGITSIAGGNVTTNVIQDPGQRLIIDFANATITARNGATIKGAIQFEKGEGENDLGTALDDLLNGLGDVEDKVDNLKIGGVNLASLKKAQDAGYSFSAYTHNNESGFWKYNVDEIYNQSGKHTKDVLGLTYKENTQYAIWVKGSTTNTSAVPENGYSSGLSIYYTDGVWQNITSFYYNKISEASVITEKGKTIDRIITKYWYGGTNFFKIQVEEGNKPTSWKPAPEDVESYADYVSEYEKLKGVNLCSYKKILDSGFTYAIELQNDGSFKIKHGTLHNETTNPNNKDMFGMEGEYLENTQYTFTLHNITNNATTGTTLYFIVHYSDGTTRDDITTPYDSKTFSFTTQKNKTILKIRGTYNYGGYTIAQFKLEVGDTATPYTISPDDREYIVDNELTEITDLQSDFQESLNAINSDEYFSISEKKIIRTDWEAISGINSTSESNSYTTLSGSYGEAYQLANGKVSTQDLTDKFSALRLFLHNQGTKGLYVDEDWNWGANGRKDMSDRFTAYYNAEVALLQAYNDYFAEKQVKDLQIGGVNLVSNIPSNWEQGSFTESKVLGTDYSEVCNYVTSTRIRIKNAIEVKGNIYIKIHNSGYEAAFIQFDENKKYLGRETFVTWHTDAPHTLHNDTRYICLILRKSNNANITPSDITNVKIQLEKGNKATAWKPNDADIIEARENILKDAMLFTLNDTALPIDLTKSIEPNTEYVFSLESNVLPTNANSVKVRLYEDPQEAYYWEDTYLFEFNITSGTKFAQTLIFNASISKLYFNASKANVTLVGVKLAEGNKYTGWEGTPDEQQALITLNNAMKGSTDIIGGLVMTNLIGMKGYGTEASQIKAGISGLNENNNLRFWAGSTAWSNANTAPFRVYDDGRVFGTHFYGFFSAFEVNASNISSISSTVGSYKQLNLGVTGSNILLNYSTAMITLPSDIKYVGSEVQIYNPKKYGIPTCNFVPYYSQCTIKNYETNISLAISSYVGAITLSTTPSAISTSYSMPRWSVQQNSCVNYKPAYVKFRAVQVNLNVESGYNKYVPDWVKNCKVSGTINNTAETPLNNGQKYYKIMSNCTFVIWIMVEYSTSMT